MDVVDETAKLSSAEKDDLINHVIHECYSTPVDRAWLRKIVVREAGATKYTGYWRANLKIDSATDIVIGVRALIVLNASFLKTSAERKETLSHEYGHHVTLSYLLTSRSFAPNMTALLGARAPLDYYRARNLMAAYQDLDPHYGRGWAACDKEILAEDYRVLLTTSKVPHRMRAKHGDPPPFMKEWLSSLFSPWHHPGVDWPF